VPVTGLPALEELKGVPAAEYVRMLWEEAPSHHNGNFNLSFDGCTHPVYRVADQEIEDWIDGLPPELGPRTRDSARIIGRALRDYGWFISDTSGGAHLQFESRLSAGARWSALGLDDQEVEWQLYPPDLLDGLMTEERLYALVPSDQYPAPDFDFDLALTPLAAGGSTRFTIAAAAPTTAVYLGYGFAPGARPMPAVLVLSCPLFRRGRSLRRAPRTHDSITFTRTRR